MYLTVEQAADLIQVHPQSVRTWLRNGAVKGVKFGRSWRIKEEWLLEFGLLEAPIKVPSIAERERRAAAALERIKKQWG
jgi:excisionase family DNA binding protein